MVSQGKFAAWATQRVLENPNSLATLPRRKPCPTWRRNSPQITQTLGGILRRARV
jgi:hypothetical protein